jgi:hypothetical protein
MDINSFRSNGKIYTYEEPKGSPDGDFPIGPYMKRTEKAERAQAAADQRALQIAQAANAKQQRREAKLLAQQLARDFTPY